MGQWSQAPERKEQSKKQDHIHGLQKRFMHFQRSAWKTTIGCGPGEKSSPGELIGSHGSPPTSSRMLHHDLHEIMQRWQKACVVKQGTADISNIKTKCMRYESRVR